MVDMLNFADVSSAQGSDISSIVSQNDGVIVKATEGNYYVNPQFNSQVNQVISAGKKLGIYHFINGGVPAETQAQYLLDNIGTYASQANVPLILDFENNSSSLNSDGSRKYPQLTGTEITPFVNYIKSKTGKTVMLYANVSDTKSYNLINYNLPLWVAGYPLNDGTGYTTDLQTWADTNYFSGYKNKVTMWQYTSVPYDKSVFYSNATAWDNLAGIVNSNTGIPIVQYSDGNGNRAYAKTHLQAIDGFSDDLKKAIIAGNYFLLDYVQLKSPNGTVWKLNIGDDGKLMTEKDS